MKIHWVLQDELKGGSGQEYSTSYEDSPGTTRRTERWLRPGIPDPYLLKDHCVLQDEQKKWLRPGILDWQSMKSHGVLQDKQKGSSGQEYPTVLSDGWMTDLVLQDEQKGGSGQHYILQQ